MAKSILNVECTYNGLSVARSGVTTIRFKAPFGEIVNYVNILGLIGLETQFAIRNDDNKFKKVGIVRIKSLNINKEGEANIQVYGENLDLPDISSMMEKVIKIGFIKEDGGEASE